MGGRHFGSEGGVVIEIDMIQKFVVEALLVFAKGFFYGIQFFRMITVTIVEFPMKNKFSF